MSETATQVQEQNTQTQNEPLVEVKPNVNQQLAESMWGDAPMQKPEPPNLPAAPIVEPPKPEITPEESADEIIGLDDYFKNNFGVDAATAKTKWETLNKLEQTPASPELTFVNDESKRIFELIKEGKTDEVYNVLERQRQLDRLEKYDINNVSQAAEIIKANLQYKHAELSPQQINRLFERQYTMPEKPVQSVDQDDADFAVELEGWNRQVKDKEQDMIIDATLAKPELIKYKSQIVLPDIQKVDNTNQDEAQKELLAKQLEGIENFKKSLEKDYQNFKGFNVTAIDGEVQLPISYTISPEEVAASKDMFANFDLNQFFDQRWFDPQGNPKITQIQEDLYLLNNREKVFQKIANEASAQRLLHQQKIQNNIKLTGVNPNLTVPNPSIKNENQAVAEAIWGM